MIVAHIGSSIFVHGNMTALSQMGFDYIFVFDWSFEVIISFMVHLNFSCSVRFLGHAISFYECSPAKQIFISFPFLNTVLSLDSLLLFLLTLEVKNLIFVILPQAGFL